MAGQTGRTPTGHRVVITGVGFTSPIAHSLSEATQALTSGKTGVRHMPEFAEIGNLATRLAAPIVDKTFKYPRKKIRTMGRLGILSTWATEQAIADSGLSEDMIQSGSTGLTFGSTHGSSSAQEAFCETLFGARSLAGIPGSAYLKFMSHTAAANLAATFGITGRVLATCSACTSSSQGIGYGYESVKFGVQDIMIGGGAEEMHFTHAGIFDILYATSTKYNEEPDRSPRPFDTERDGLVVGEGAGTFVLERYDHATARGASIYAEILGFGNNCDGSHLTHPSAKGMAGAMTRALADAGLNPNDIDYINAHGTATAAGDVAESLATASVFGNGVPFSGNKGATGHTLGACGAIEAAFCLAMMRDGFIAPTHNLATVDPECGDLDYVIGDARQMKPRTVMTNNFAFGGINTSLILRTL